MGVSLKIKPSTPKLKMLYKKARFKVAYGGRGSGKSMGFAEAIIYYCLLYNIRVLCCREIQKSIKESSYRLLVDTIDRLGVSSEFTILSTEIICNTTGARIIFAGLKHNVQSIKSMEGINICWIEEGQTTSMDSWNILVPTIRANGAEIWVTMNPDLPTDAMSQIFLSGSLPPSTLIEHINYTDNKFFPSSLKDDVAFCKANDEDLYNHVWLGGFMAEGDDLLIPLKFIKAAQARRLVKVNVPTIAGLDVARYGDDKSSLVIRKGNEIIHRQKWSKIGLNVLEDSVTNAVVEHGIDTLVIDAVGVGGGVMDHLKDRLDIKVVEFNGGYRASDSHYFNARTETWCEMKQWIKDEGVLPVDIELQGQLSTIKYKINNKTQIQLESKDEMKKRGLHSPDDGDSLSMTFFKAAKRDTKKMANKLFSNQAEWQG